MVEKKLIFYGLGKKKVPNNSKLKIKKCPQTRKICYPSEEEANRQLEVIKFFSLCWRKEQRVYQCEFCGRYHMTSQKKKKEKP